MSYFRGVPSALQPSWRQLRGAVWMTAATAALTAAACGGRTEQKVEEIIDAGPDAPFDAGTLPAERTSDKLDVLLVIDNTVSSGPAHTKLSQTIPYLLDRLANPACVNGFGEIVDEPASLEAPCEAGVRDFAPLQDVHIAVISSSLGGHGADLCSTANSSFHPEQNDAAHLLTRNAAGGVVPSYDNLGFLLWDPMQARQPPGDDDVPSLANKLSEIVNGVGIRGCGFESQLEAFYRFLVDPDPYDSIAIVDGNAVLQGTDQRVLQERASFLRPDSALLVVSLSDEDDCSVRDGGEFYFANQAESGGMPFRLPRPRDICATDPNDECCRSCGQSPGPGCSDNDTNCQMGSLSQAEDPLNLRCFDQKRRFGIDFLQPVERYVNGLQADEVQDRFGNPVKNPLFVGTRGKTMVAFAGIVGVPWQDIARNPADITAGFIPNNELNWGLVLTDLSDGTPPEDPLMIPSRTARSGVNPATDSALQPANAGYLANPINGHEHNLNVELQYACIYQLAEPIDCSAAATACNCAPGTFNNNPLCQNSNGQYSSIQRFGRATPATRQLQLLQALGPQGVVGSICADPSSDIQSPAFGYKPSVDAMMRRIRYALEPPAQPSEN